jgi:hypothetical protein
MKRPTLTGAASKERRDETMKGHRPAIAKARRLPQTLRPFFWDHDFARLSWKADRDLIIGRILAVGNWESIRWLGRRATDDGLRAWFMQTRGIGLSKRHLRFWELILGLPHRKVNAWMADPERAIWDEQERLERQKYDFWSKRNDD